MQYCRKSLVPPSRRELYTRYMIGELIMILRPFFACKAKNPRHTGVRTGLHYLISLSVCVPYMRSIRVFYCLRELYEADFHKFGIYGSARVWANAWEVFRRTPYRGGRGRRAVVDFVVCFGCGGISFFSFFFVGTHTTCCKYEAALPHLPLY